MRAVGNSDYLIDIAGGSLRYKLIESLAIVGDLATQLQSECHCLNELMEPHRQLSRLYQNLAPSAELQVCSEHHFRKAVRLLNLDCNPIES